MKKKYINTILVFIFLLCSCSNKPSLIKDTIQLSNQGDVTIKEYELSNIKSSEGNRSIIYYSSGHIDSSVTFIYGDIGQIKIRYYFFPDYIYAVETSYLYNAGLSQIGYDFFIKDSTIISYQLDYNGKIIDDIGTTNVQNIFEEFKNTIPFHISSQ